MAVARRRRLPVLTLDFRDFRPVPGPFDGDWRFVITEVELG